MFMERVRLIPDQSLPAWFPKHLLFFIWCFLGVFYQTPSHFGRGTIQKGSKEAEKGCTLDSAPFEKVTTRVSMMKALRTVIVFQVDQFNTLGGNNTYERAVDSGSGGHTWGNTALPYFRYRSSSSHTLCWCREPLFQRSRLCCDFMWT